jgi:hypothetical protein
MNKTTTGKTYPAKARISGSQQESLLPNNAHPNN